LLLLLPTLGFIASDNTFRDEQSRYPRVRAAYQARWSRLEADLQRRGIRRGEVELFLRVIKTKRTLEAWVRNRGQGPFQLLRSYPIAATSGTLGPKRRAGDGQVPEGCYFIDRFNPKSLFHLSLGLNYPNAADRAWGEADPGGDIFIHGSDVTIGCLPITDALIEELYVLAVEARASGQAEVPVHIFPFPLTEAALQEHRQERYFTFWQNLAPAYRYFETHHTLPEVSVEATGGYVVR
jgi:murein L,D-transpeptidase YafK